MAEPSEQQRRQILDEQLLSELKTIREYVSDIPQVRDNVNQLNDKVDEINGRLGAIE